MPAAIGNKYAIGNQGGRPPKYSNAQELEQKVQEYFVWVQGEYHEEEQKVFNRKTKKEETIKVQICDRPAEPITLTGLVLFLGFADKSTFYEYARKDEFSYSIKRALLIVENGYEMALSFQSPTGAIFALKNMGWEDKTKQEHTGKDGKDLPMALNVTIVKGDVPIANSEREIEE